MFYFLLLTFVFTKGPELVKNLTRYRTSVKWTWFDTGYKSVSYRLSGDIEYILFSLVELSLHPTPTLKGVCTTRPFMILMTTKDEITSV